MSRTSSIIENNNLILITGSGGFIGSRVVRALLEFGFSNLRCLVRPSSNLNALKEVIKYHNEAIVDIVKGNLLSQKLCNDITNGVQVIYHLAAGRGEKSYPDAYLNSVVTTRNLLQGAIQHDFIKRFVNVSSFTVYSNWHTKHGSLIDETSETETNPVLRGEPYCYAKVKQEQITIDFCRKHHIPYVIIRPGVVYGPGNKGIHGRVGIGTFGIFLHLGGTNIIPMTYVDNCADAITLSGIKTGVDNEIFNVVDDELPTSRYFLFKYKKNVKYFKSLYVPYRLFYLFCWLWEKYSNWSQGQLPPSFNRKMCSTYWKGNRYSNQKLKRSLQWSPRVNFHDALDKYFVYQREVVK